MDKLFENIKLPQTEADIQDLDLDKNCVGKTAMSGVMGFGMGAVFGLVMSSLDFGGPSMDPKLLEMRTRDQIRIMGKDMMKRSFSSAKNFGTLGAIFSGSECVIEGYRGKTDIYNPVWAGCFTGGVVALKSGGPYAAIPGCLTFAAFSAAIEHYIRDI